MFNAKFKSFRQPGQPLRQDTLSPSFLRFQRLTLPSSVHGVTYDAILAGIVREPATSLMYEIEGGLG